MVLLVLGLLFFVPFLGQVHLFDWDEINFAECSREMVVTGDFLQVQIDYKPFWEKPPLFFWLQAASFQVFGINEFAARLPNALCGVITLLVLFYYGQKIFDTRLGMYWSLAYLGSFLPHFYFKSGIIDPWFNLFIFLGLVQIVIFTWKRSDILYKVSKLFPLRSWWYLSLAGIFLGLAVLTKGPVAVLVILLCLIVYWIMGRLRYYIHVVHVLYLLIVAGLISGLWFGVGYLQHGPWFITQFWDYHLRLLTTPDAGHGGFPGYHFVVVLLGCFPASVLAMVHLISRPEGNDIQRNFVFWMKILLWVVLILFSIVQSKIVHYSSLTYFPLTLLAAVGLQELVERRAQWNFRLQTLFVLLGLVWILAIVILPVLGLNVDLWRHWLRDPFAQSNLNAEAGWSYWYTLSSVPLLLALLRALWLIQHYNYSGAFITMFLAVALTLNVVLLTHLPPIERTTQGAAVDFYKSLQGQHVYVRPIHYKSYAHLYYTRLQPPDNPNYYKYENQPLRNQIYLYQWMLYGDVDRDVYFITKVHRSDRYYDREGLEEIYFKNGFVVFRRREGDRVARE